MVLPLVSFVIPAYNHAPFVAQCLDSVLEDAYENKEIVIIDDGSTDGTPQVIEEWIAKYADRIPVKYRSRPNRGVTATLNELVAMSKGDFVRLGASDDFFLPQGTRKLIDYLIAHPQKSAVIGDSIVVDENGNILHNSAMVDLHGASKRLYRSKYGIAKAIISQWAVSGPVPLVRRSAIASTGGWDENLRIDDWDFFLRIASQDALGFVDEQVCAYRIHGSNSCRPRDRLVRIRNLEESRGVAQRHIERFRRPYSDMLLAQCRLVDAKVAFLRRQPYNLFCNLFAYARLKVVALVSGWGAMLRERP